jgi:hypothetical protein
LQGASPAAVPSLKETRQQLQQERDKLETTLARAPKTEELIKRIRQNNPPDWKWIFSVAMRKLNADFKTFSKNELRVLKVWVKKMRDIDVTLKQQKLEKTNASKSVDLLCSLRKQVTSPDYVEEDDSIFNAISTLREFNT